MQKSHINLDICFIVVKRTRVNKSHEHPEEQDPPEPGVSEGSGCCQGLEVPVSADANDSDTSCVILDRNPYHTYINQLVLEKGVTPIGHDYRRFVMKDFNDSTKYLQVYYTHQ